MWLVAPFVSLAFATCSLSKSLVARDATFDWNNLTASTNLSWTPCFGEFQCARLTVPLQYSDPTAGEAQIAILMSPSNFSHDDSRYLGPVLFNPGGPGGSGVDYVIESVESFREVVGPQYDLVGFDPRGVGATTPPLSVFKSPVEAFEFYSTYPLNVNESISSFGRMFAQSQILGNLTVDRAEKIAESVSTPAVATDMLTITRAFGHEQVNYWGISYGSVLGATFAAMFPNNVGRFIIDGVFNAHDWYSGNWTSALTSTDDALSAYYDACVAAGPSLCAIWENGTDLVRTRVDRLFDNLHLAPLPVFNDTDPANTVFTVLDYTVARAQLFRILYDLYEFGTFGTEAIALLEQGQGSLLLTEADITSIDGLATCDFDMTQPFVAGFLDVSSAIECGDVLSTALPTMEEARDAYANALSLSSFASGLYPNSMGSCVGWPIRGKDRLNGSFITNTSSPMLVIGNTLDPATPLASARNMSAGFTNSVLLQQNSIGHTSTSASSICTSSVIHAYFANGTLPAPGTICQVESTIFGGANSSTAPTLQGALHRRSAHGRKRQGSRQFRRGSKRMFEL